MLYGRRGEVVGVATGDVGIAKDGTQKDAFARGMELRSRVTLLAEGCRGSLSEVQLFRAPCTVHMACLRTQSVFQKTEQHIIC